MPLLKTVIIFSVIPNKGSFNPCDFIASTFGENIQDLIERSSVKRIVSPSSQQNGGKQCDFCDTFIWLKFKLNTMHLMWLEP